MFRQCENYSPLTLYFTEGSKPLELWQLMATDSKDYELSLIHDTEIDAKVHQLIANDLSKVHLKCPANFANGLGLSLPHLVIILKNLNKEFSMEVKALDDKNRIRRIRVSTFQLEKRVTPEILCLKLDLEPSWNQVVLDLRSLIRKYYITNFKEVIQITLNPNCCIRRIFLCDQISFSEQNLPAEFKLYK
ncbi:DUF667-domain-containing protein [Neoconidiobolus thromboides FSU 785]|nr:DUF667-domain-containing protein [Neoconidiobolus thromboides FSU 785]